MFLTGNKIFAIKVDLLNLESQNQAETFPWVSQIPQSKYEANQSRGFWVMIDKQTYRQTKRDYSFIYMDNYKIY